MSDAMPKSIEELFLVGMKRNTWLATEFYPKKDAVVLDLGCGKCPTEGAIPLDLPDWDARDGVIPWPDCSVDVIHAHHFLEHIPNVIEILAECQRVLKFRGSLFITVPWWNCKLAYHDMNHIRYFTLDNWRVLFRNERYNSTQGKEVEWKFDVAFNMILAVKETDLAVCSQLVKAKEGI